MITVRATVIAYAPTPAAMPSAAVLQRLAAVVRPRIVNPSLRIAPAPRKPMPDTTCAAMRVGSVTALGPPKPWTDRTVNAAEPSATSKCVRIPAG
jgi:hypothetical protein